MRSSDDVFRERREWEVRRKDLSLYGDIPEGADKPTITPIAQQIDKFYDLLTRGGLMARLFQIERTVNERPNTPFFKKVKEWEPDPNKRYFVVTPDTVEIVQAYTILAKHGLPVQNQAIPEYQWDQMLPLCLQRANREKYVKQGELTPEDQEIINGDRRNIVIGLVNCIHVFETQVFVEESELKDDKSCHGFCLGSSKYTLPFFGKRAQDKRINVWQAREVLHQYCDEVDLFKVGIYNKVMDHLQDGTFRGDPEKVRDAVLRFVWDVENKIITETPVARFLGLMSALTFFNFPQPKNPDTDAGEQIGQT